MTNAERLKKQLVELYSLARVQQSLRLALRALWLGMAGVLVGWGANELWGWLPNPLTWILIGLAFALAPILMIWIALYPVLFGLDPKQGWVWQLDRSLALREQFSTAWEVAQKKQPGGVSDILLQEVLSWMPKVREGALRAGWYRKLDVLSTLAVMLVACFLLATALLRPPAPPATNRPGEAAPLAAGSPDAQPAAPTRAPSDLLQMQSQAPGAGDQATGDAAGGSSSARGNQQGQGAGQGKDPQKAAPADPNLGATADALRQMGSELSQQAGTYDLGQALQNLDMNGSADALHSLAGRLNDLSPQSRENLTQAMHDAAGAIRRGSEGNLSQDLGQAADALAGEDPAANQALERVAEDLRPLADALGNAANLSSEGTRGDRSGTGVPEPLQRLAGEGGELNLPQNPGAPSDLLNPAPANAAPGNGAVGGAYNSPNAAGEDVIQTPLLPGSSLWKWRDVVSEYFHR